MTPLKCFPLQLHPAWKAVLRMSLIVFGCEKRSHQAVTLYLQLEEVSIQAQRLAFCLSMKKVFSSIRVVSETQLVGSVSVLIFVHGRNYTVTSADVRLHLSSSFKLLGDFLAHFSIAAVRSKSFTSLQLCLSMECDAKPCRRIHVNLHT